MQITCPMHPTPPSPLVSPSGSPMMSSFLETECMKKGVVVSRKKNTDDYRFKSRMFYQKCPVVEYRKEMVSEQGRVYGDVLRSANPELKKKEAPKRRLTTLKVHHLDQTHFHYQKSVPSKIKGCFTSFAMTLLIITTSYCLLKESRYGGTMCLFYLFSFSEILAQESRNVTVRLNTRALSEESTGSTQK